MSEHKANLDAWQVLQTVIDAGGFTQAATRLKRSQSAISYSISKLEDQLQLELLTIQGRRAVLTNTGELLLGKARRLLSDYQQLIDYARHLNSGHAAEISLWLDGIYPVQRLQKALLEFRQQFPLTRLNLQHGTTQVDLNEIDIIISPVRFPGKSHHQLGKVELMAVAHVNHPLFEVNEPIEPIDQATLAQFPRITLTSESALETAQNWPVTTLQQAREYILLGLAYGWLPIEMVADDLKAGQLKPLPLASGQHEHVSVYLQYSVQQPENKDVQSLTKLLDLA